MIDPQTVLSLIAFAVMGVGGVAWWRAIRGLSLGRPILPYEPRRHVPWGLLDLILIVATYFVVIVVSAVVGEFSGMKLAGGVTKENAGQMLLLQLAIQLLTTFPPLLVIAVRTRAAWADLGFDLSLLRRDVKTGAIAFAMLAPPVFAIQAVLTKLIPYQHDVIDIIRQNPDLLWLSGVSAVLAAPLTEELQFRVLLQGWLEKVAVWRGDPLRLLIGRRRPAHQAPKAQVSHQRSSAVAADSPSVAKSSSEPLSETVDANVVAAPGHDAASTANPYASPAELTGDPPQAVGPPDHLAVKNSGDDFAAAPPRWFDRWPMLVSAILFAGMHLGQGPAPAPLFVLALGLGYLYERTHRATPAITVHLLLNATTMVILAVEVLSPGAGAAR